MSSNNKTNILMVSLFYQGHINPMFRLAELLTSKGLHITIATTKNAQYNMQNSYKKFNFIDFEYFEDGLDTNLDREKNLDILLDKYLPKDGARNLSDLIIDLEGKGKKISCVINNIFVPWVANVAKSHNIPCAMLWVQSCATYGIYYHYFKKNCIFPSLNDPNNIINIPGLPTFKVEDLPTFILPSSPPHFLNVIAKTIEILDQFDWVFGSSFQEIEENLVKSMAKHKPILPIGPLVSPIMLEEVTNLLDDNDHCINWLNKQCESSIIYIALGSISVLSQSETEAIVNALENDCKLGFLWVRNEPKEGWGREMGKLPKEFLEKTKDKGLIISWCNQDKVLMHPSIKCFLTHCGWNSTLEAITAGVPVICYPDWTDQVTNAKLLVDVFKVGVRMRKNKEGKLDKYEVQRCISEVTEGSKGLAMKNQAIKWKDASKKTNSYGGSSYGNIDKFISDIKKKVL